MVRKGSPVQVRLRAPPPHKGTTRFGRPPSGSRRPDGSNHGPIKSVLIPVFGVGGSGREGTRTQQRHLDIDRTHQFCGRLVLVAALLVCGLLASLTLTTAAHAARGLTTGFDGVTYLSSDPNIRAESIDRTLASGARVVRMPAFWASIAAYGRPPDPTNPGSTSYDFSLLDEPVRHAAGRGLGVMLTLSGAPDWAAGPGRPESANPSTWKPNPSDLGDFTQALAARYSGDFDPDGSGPQAPFPAAQSIEVWNEPNTSGALEPQFQGKTALSPDIYRDMLNAVYRAVKSVDPKMLVVTGGTDPYGDRPGGPYPPGIQRVQPVQFWERVLCVHRVKRKKKKYVRTQGCSKPAMFDVLAHHAIDNTGQGPLASGPLPGDASTPDLGRITRVLRGAESAGTTLPGRHPVWVTEFWWDSNPPNRSGPSLAVQARWFQQSLYLFWKGGADTAINFRFYDSSERPNVAAGYQSGVYFRDGRPKPSLTAARFPFVTARIDRRTLQAWGRAPEDGELVIQRKRGGRWRSIKKLQVRKGAVFLTKLRLSGKQRLRAIVGNEQSLVWKQAAYGKRRQGGSGLPSAGTIVLLLIGAALLALVSAAVLRRRQVVRRRRKARRRRPARRPLSGRPPGPTAIAWGATDGGRVTGHPRRRRGR
jgi:hypothetical protein